MFSSSIDEDFDWFRGGVVVSCQAPSGSPLRSTVIMEAMAQAAALAGAVGIRADGPDDLAAIRSVVNLPLIGIRKRSYDDSPVYITATTQDVDAVASTGAPIVALDATARQRPHGETLAAVIDHAKRRQMLVMADLGATGDAAAAIDNGADALATTLIGPSEEDVRPGGPNLAAIGRLRRQFPQTPVIAEGRLSAPQDVRDAFSAGATSVVVGTAITDALALAGGFVGAARAAVLAGVRGCGEAAD